MSALDELLATSGLADKAARVDDHLARFVPTLPTGVTLVASAGTATTLAALDLQLPAYDPDRVHGHALAPATVEGWTQRLLAMTTAERRALPGMEAPRADVIDRLVRGEPPTETAPALAARLTYDTVDSHHLSVVIIWPGTQEAGLYAGAADLAIEPVLRELIRTDHRLWSHDPALDVVNVDQDLIPETLRAAMLADGVVEVLSMRADVSGRTGVVVLQFVRDTNLGGLSGNTRLAYHELRLALTRTLEREEGERGRGGGSGLSVGESGGDEGLRGECAGNLQHMGAR